MYTRLVADAEALIRAFRFATFEVDLKSRELLRDGVRIAIQEKPFRLLEALLLARGDVVTRAELASALWPGVRHVAAEMGINTAARKLRRTLGDSARNPRFVETVPGVGYRLLPETAALADPARAPRFELDIDVPAAGAPAGGRRRRWLSPAFAGGLALAVAAGVWVAQPDTRSSADPVSSAATPSRRPLPVTEPARRQFLAALHLKTRGTSEGAERAAELFEEVTRREPDFDRAHGELALSLAHRTLRAGPDCERCERRAREAVSRALRRSPDLPEALLADGILAIHLDWDWRRADQALRRAADIAPRDPETHLVMATWMAITARHEEALFHVRRAIELDPGSFLVRSDAGFFYLAAGRDEEAAAECRVALDVDPSFIPARRCLLLASARRGAFAEAARQARFLMIERGASAADVAAFDAAGAREGLRLFWRWKLQRLEATTPEASPVSYAAVFAQLDQEQTALAWLERAYASRHPNLVFLNLFAELSPLRGLPEFESLIERLGLPHGAAPRDT